MIQYNGKKVELNHFPDGTLLMKETVTEKEIVLRWNFENNEEMVALYFLVKHFRAQGVKRLMLELPYIPNARQDRVKTPEDIFTLKYFAELINSLEFTKVTVLDPHSYVSEALFERIDIQTPKYYVEKVLEKITTEKVDSKEQQGIEENRGDEVRDNLVMFFPDEGAMKRYSAMFELPYVFGIKKRDWKTGKIQGLDAAGAVEKLRGTEDYYDGTPSEVLVFETA